ncbi:MAG: hypothetical protein RDU25_00940 [Patescibacteria group bacterium]|nr:hypothetical protein [Patescibacteria group bacterium]
MEMTMDGPSGLGLLGQQIMLAITAFRAEPDTVLYCAVRGSYFAAREILTGEGARKFLVYDSLPGALDVKAIGLDQKVLFLELTPFDFERLEEYRDEFPKDVQFRKDGMWCGRRKLAHMGKGPMKPDAEHGMRSLWMIDWSELDQELLGKAIATFDLADSVGAYISDPSAEDDSPDVSGNTKPSLELRMNFQLQLIHEQVPILALQLEHRTEQRTEQRLELTLEQTLRFERWLERNPEEAVEVYLANHPTPQGARHLASLIQFKLARDVKEIARREGRQIDWPEARRIVRKLVHRRSNAA